MSFEFFIVVVMAYNIFNQKTNKQKSSSMKLFDLQTNIPTLNL